jgi:hypothetical protein
MVRKRVVGEGVAQHHLAVLVALDQEVGGGHGIGARVVVLSEDLDRGLFVVGANPVLRLRQHAARAASRIADGDDDAGLGEHAGIGLQQQVDHELDHFTRGEVVAGRFVGGFVEAPDQVFEHQTHGDVVDLARMQVDLGELGDHLIEAIGFFELLDLLVELEALEDLADVLGEAVDVISQMAADVVRVALELVEVELAVVVEAQRGAVFILRQVVEDGVDIGDAFAAQFGVALEHGFLAGRQHGVEAAQHGQRQHHALVLRRAVGAAQQIGDGPDEVGELLKEDVDFQWKALTIKDKVEGERSIPLLKRYGPACVVRAFPAPSPPRATRHSEPCWPSCLPLACA